MARAGFIFIFFVLCTYVKCQDTTRQHRSENCFRIQYDNDVFSFTDRYYTQGIIATFIHPALKHSLVFYALPKLAHSKNYFGITLEQDVFTPKSIRYDSGAVYKGERPYTALLYLSHTLNSLNAEKKILLQTRLDLGILGPQAKGEETQKAIHEAIDDAEPLGWQNQLSQDVMVNYSARFEKGIFTSRYFEFMGTTNARLGTIYTDAGAGLKVRCGIMDSNFSNPGISKNNRGLKLFAVLNGNLKVVGYNATLQGGLLSGNNIYVLPANSVSRFVAEASASVFLFWRRVGLEFGKYYVTPEFSGGIDHGWGRVGLWVGF
jgi:lipid A 3-O-deacylase